MEFVMSKFGSEKDLYKAKAEYYEKRCEVMKEILTSIAAQSSGIPGSTDRADCMAALAKIAIKD